MKKFARHILLATAVALFACAGCTAAVTAATTPEVTPGPTVAPTPEPDLTYTIAWMSDTQHYSSRFAETFYAMTQYLKDNREQLNLAYVAHTGDLVASYAKEHQWKIASRAMATIADIPAGVCAGNHDVHHSSANYENYGRYFGEEQCSYRPCYGGSFENNRGHYDLIDAGKSRLLFLYMGYSVTDEGIDWMKGVIEAYPERAVIICTHAYLDTNLSFLEDGRRIRDELVAVYPNVYMVLGGHRYNVACVPAEYDDDGDGRADRTVYQMICNYQSAGKEGGSGYMMFMRVNEQRGVIQLYTYSPVLNDQVLFDDIQARNGYYRNAPESERTILAIPWEYE